MAVRKHNKQAGNWYQIRNRDSVCTFRVSSTLDRLCIFLANATSQPALGKLLPSTMNGFANGTGLCTGCAYNCSKKVDGSCCLCASIVI